MASLRFCRGYALVSVRLRGHEHIAAARALHGQPSDQRSPYAREYFYYVDMHGQLFLAETKIRNFTSCFKDKAFLDFFFRRLRPNDTGRFSHEYPYVSPCGREMNFVAVEDTPIVFHSLDAEEDGFRQYVDVTNGAWIWGGADGLGPGWLGERDPTMPGTRLCWGGQLTVPFEPSQLFFSPEGRLYHPSPLGSRALVRSALALELLRGSSPTEDGTLSFAWRGRVYAIPIR